MISIWYNIIIYIYIYIYYIVYIIYHILYIFNSPTRIPLTCHPARRGSSRTRRGSPSHVIQPSGHPLGPDADPLRRDPVITCHSLTTCYSLITCHSLITRHLLFIRHSLITCHSLCSVSNPFRIHSASMHSWHISAKPCLHPASISNPFWSHSSSMWVQFPIHFGFVLHQIGLFSQSFLDSFCLHLGTDSVSKNSACGE